MMLMATYELPIAALSRFASKALTPYLVTGAAAFASAVLLSLLLTFVVRWLAPHCNLVDRPDNYRKLHGKPIPLGGGLAVYLTMVVILGLLIAIPNPWSRHLQSNWVALGRLATSGGVMVLLGLLDDRFHLRGRIKLLGQCLAAAVLIAGGLKIGTISFFGYNVDLGVVAIPVTLCWLLGAINSVNLLDGIDGLATILGLIMASTICVMAILEGQTMEGLTALVLAGSLFGFLRFNFPPASIFLGDAGSMLIGMVIGALAISASLKGPGTVLLAAPLAVWTIPFFDSLAAIVRRRLTGRSIYTTDRGHLHHRLLDLLGNNQRVLAVVAAFCLLTSSGTVLSMFLKNDLVAVLTCTAMVVILVASGIFGRAEFNLVTNRLRRLGRSLMQPAQGGGHRVQSSVVRLQGTKPWESLFQTLTASAEQHALVEVRLDVNAPRSREGYHARWEFPVDDAQRLHWRLEFPLVVNEQRIGTLLVAGLRQCLTLCQDLERLQILLRPFEDLLQTMVEDVPIADEPTLPAAEAELAHSGAGRLSRQHPR